MTGTGKLGTPASSTAGMAQPIAGAAASGPTRVAVDDLTRVVALDGPAGTGKSSVARGVARQLGWRFVDTGATYRAATLAVQRAGADLRDVGAVESVVSSCRIALVTDPGRPAVFLNGDDVSAEIRSAEVTGSVSAVSSVPGVRALMIAVQREAMGGEGSVVEGRDIATVVAPGAVVKVYLDARPEVRAQRRARELLGSSGAPADEDGTYQSAVGEALARRDGQDSATNKLEVSEGAVYLDTSDLSLDQVVDVIVGLVAEQLGREA